MDPKHFIRIEEGQRDNKDGIFAFCVCLPTNLTVCPMKKKTVH
jgi:hypothetical protein